jgi:hypothetical protein
VYPHITENITCIAFREPADLTRYLDAVTSHLLVASQHRELVRMLSRVAVQPVWNWVEARYQATLDQLQEITRMILTLEGPFHLLLGRVLEDFPIGQH